MSDYDLPDLPSDEDLGLTEDDIRAIEEEMEAERKKSAGEPAAAASGGRADGPAAKAPPGSPPPPKKKRPSPPADRPSGGWRGPVTLVFLLLVGWATVGERVLPDPVGPAAPDTAFSSGRAMLDMVAKARYPHPPGSPWHAEVREMLIERLTDLGLAPEVQTTTSMIRRGDQVRAATIRNVLARIPGTESTGAIVLTAHYDGRGISRAAGDDGSGVSAILETVRALQAGPRLRNDVLVVLTDAEELGLLGARAFVDQHPWMQDVAVVLSVEMRGGGGPSIMFETGSENGWIVEAFDEALGGDVQPFANALSVEVYRRMPNDTDFSPFRDIGVQGLNFAGIGNAHVYHQEWDVPERFDERTLQHHGAQLLATARHLGDRDLSVVDAPDRAYFSIPLLGLITYPTAVGYGLAMLVLVAFIGVYVLVSRQGDAASGAGGPSAVLAGVLLSAVSMGGTAGAAYGLFAWTRTLHPEYGSLHGSAFHVESWYAAAVVAVGAAVTVATLALLRKKFSLGGLALGAALPAALGAVIIAFVAPLGSQTLQWPVIFALFGAGLVAGVGRHRRPGLPAWIGLLVLAVGVAVFAVPLTGFVWLALSFAAAPVLGGVIGLWLTLLVPLLDTLREPGGGWAPVLGVVAAGVFVAVGMAHAEPTAERPAPSTLVWVLDRDSAGPVWATRDGPGVPWAEARAGALTTTRDLDGLGLVAGGWRTGPAEPRDVPPPSVTALVAGPETGTGTTADAPGSGPGATTDAPQSGSGATTDASETAPGVPAVEEPAGRPDDLGAPGDPSGLGRRTVTVSIRSQVGAEGVRIRIPSSADAYLRRIDGRDVPEEAPDERSGARRVAVVSHWGSPVAAAGTRLTFDVGASVEALELEVVEHLLRPAELTGPSFWIRPPALSPDITHGSDRAVVRTRVLVDPRTGAVRMAPRPASTPAGDRSDPAAATPDTGTAPDPGTASDAAPAADTATPDTAATPDTTTAPDTAATSR